MDERLIGIGKTRDGWEVECLDPKISKANSGNGPWQDPWVCYQFDDKEDALEFLEAALDIVQPRKVQASTEFDAAFKEATSADETKDSK